MREWASEQASKQVSSLVSWFVVWVKRPTNSLGHMETGPRFIHVVPSDGLEKPGIEPATPGLQGE